MTARRFMMPSGGSPFPQIPLSNVSSLLHFDGANNGTSFPDSAGKLTWTKYGTPTTTTSNFVFGTASGNFNGSSALGSITDNQLNLMSGSFVIEMMIRPASIFSGGRRVFSVGGGTVAWGGVTHIHILLQLSDSNNILNFQVATGGSSPINVKSTETVPINQWSHIVAQYNSATNQIALGVNGILKYFTASGKANWTTNSYARIGTIPGESLNNSYTFRGQIDEFRVSKGVAPYTGATYPVPVQQYSL